MGSRCRTSTCGHMAMPRGSSSRTPPSPHNVAVILDLEGAVPQRAISPRLWWILSLASAAVAAAALLVVNALPHEQLARFVVGMSGPSVLQQGFAKPPSALLSLTPPAARAVAVPPAHMA